MNESPFVEYFKATMDHRESSIKIENMKAELSREKDVQAGLSDRVIQLEKECLSIITKKGKTPPKQRPRQI